MLKGVRLGLVLILMYVHVHIAAFSYFKSIIKLEARPYGNAKTGKQLINVR